MRGPEGRVGESGGEGGHMQRYSTTCCVSVWCAWYDDADADVDVAPHLLRPSIISENESCRTAEC